ncbi:MlaA family lipoprotein [Succinivibrio dextrinosolvens]|uniref:MlaA family lipoprotein n=1 Tax=Succinivibrio dextrinosolvens TaxID=83771 RepID=UPI00247A41BA|nr:VacJ family lipoprotein [Succinivibrio dextrinosolvens]
MYKKLVLLALSLCLLSGESALAFHSNYSPMAPRQLTYKASHADYSYGLTILPGNSIDSIEGFNRNLPWQTNYYVLDRYILRPVAHGYAMLPQFSRTGIHNFIGNVGELNNTVNNLFLGNFADSGISVSRFAINSTIGILGLFDVATPMGIERREMSFDTVQGRAGADSGAYLMIPAMGPSTERALHGTVVDAWPTYFVSFPISLAFNAISVIDTRAGLIPQEEMIDNSVDPYAQVRTAYLQYHEGKVNPNAAMENKKDENVEEFLDEID